MLHKDEIDEGDVVDAGLGFKGQQNNAGTKAKEVIDVERSPHFSFRLKPMDNPILNTKYPEENARDKRKDHKHTFNFKNKEERQ